MITKYVRRVIHSNVQETVMTINESVSVEPRKEFEVPRELKWYQLHEDGTYVEIDEWQELEDQLFDKLSEETVRKYQQQYGTNS